MLIDLCLLCDNGVASLAVLEHAESGRSVGTFIDMVASRTYRFGDLTEICPIVEEVYTFCAVAR